MTLPSVIDATDLKRRLDAGEDLLVLDVREPDEVAHCKIPGSVWIPMREIPDRHAELPASRAVVVYCHAGVRSASVAKFLRERAGRDAVANLTGGIDAWSTDVDPTVPRY